VNVIDPDTLDCSNIFLPNAFTPSASFGRNDMFRVSNPYAIDEFISLEVFDRWGGRMFNATSAFDAWDGNFGGKPVNPGVFLFRLRYKCEGEEKVKAGNLTLIR
jgi:gliding motility-associated-like protein